MAHVLEMQPVWGCSFLMMCSLSTLRVYYSAFVHQTPVLCVLWRDVERNVSSFSIMMVGTKEVTNRAVDYSKEQ